MLNSSDYAKNYASTVGKSLRVALTTARAGLATQAMGAFVKVKIWEDLRLDFRRLPIPWGSFSSTAAYNRA